MKYLVYLFYILLALVLVRQRFWGRRIGNGMLDLPFAISPVVVGNMFASGAEGPSKKAREWVIVVLHEQQVVAERRADSHHLPGAQAG